MKPIKPWIVVMALGMVSVLSEAHDQPVHEAIARSAFLSSDGLSSFFSDISEDQNKLLFFQPREFHPNAPYPSIYWVTNGAFHEDDFPRFGDHFYTVKSTRTPGQVIGLTDSSESLYLNFFYGITNSYAWGTVPGLYGPSSHNTNTETWECARGYELAALTNSVPANRDSNMAHMFYALGHVLHLNEDLSQPDHVRNDEHLIPKHRWIENFGSETYLHETNTFPLEPRGWAYWQSQGFSNILDFWDRGHYLGNASALNADKNGGDKLGLAEFSNGNFLGEDATYKEYFNSSDIHYFPFPSRQNGTIISSETYSLKSGHLGTNYYLTKNKDGIFVKHHSRLTMWGVKHPGLMNHRATTIFDTNVLQDYHDILIPKAIEYSAGVLDYFFRGTLSVQTIGYDTNSMLYTNLIKNTSGQSFSGGNFSIYQDDPSGNRNLMGHTNISDAVSGGVLSDGQSFTMTFSGPLLSTNKLLALFKGNVGTTDPVDANIAIATKAFNPTFTQTKEYDYHAFDDDLSLPFTLSTNLTSDDFPFTPTADNYEVIINSGTFDDAGTIGGIGTTAYGSDCGAPANFTGLPIIIPSDQVSIVGNHLEITLTCTDNCHSDIGWQVVSITWRAWPAQ